MRLIFRTGGRAPAPRGKDVSPSRSTTQALAARRVSAPSGPHPRPPPEIPFSQESRPDASSSLLKSRTGGTSFHSRSVAVGGDLAPLRVGSRRALVHRTD